MTILDKQLVSDGTEVELPFNRKKLPTEPGSSWGSHLKQPCLVSVLESVLVKRRKKMSACQYVSD